MTAARWFTFGPRATGSGFHYLEAQFERLPYLLQFVIAAALMTPVYMAVL